MTVQSTLHPHSPAGSSPTLEPSGPLCQPAQDTGDTPDGEVAVARRATALLEEGTSKLLECDLAFEELVGRSLAEMRGVSVLEYIIPSSRPEKDALELALTRQIDCELPLTVELRSGRSTRIKVGVSGRKTDGGNIVCTTWQELNRPPGTNGALVQSAVDAQLLLNLVNHLCAASSLEQLAEAVHLEVCASTGWDRIFISQWHEQSKTVIPLAVFPATEHLLDASPIVIESAPELAAAVSTRCEAQVDTRTDSSDQSKTPWSRFPSQLHVRASHQDGMNILLSFCAEHSVEEDTRDRDAELATACAPHVARAYCNLRLDQSREQEQALLETLLSETSAVSGKQFFDALVRQLALALGAEITSAAQFLGGAERRLRSISTWANGGFQDELTYDVEDTPCAIVAREGELIIQSGVQELFPKDEFLGIMGVHAYLGVAIADSGGKPIGILCALSSNRIENAEQAVSVLKFFATRAATELERLRREELLHETLSSREILIELLEMSLATESLTSKLDRSVRIISDASLGKGRGRGGLYLSSADDGEFHLAAHRGLDESAESEARDQVRTWCRQNIDEIRGSEWLGATIAVQGAESQPEDFCLVPIRFHDSNYGVLALQLGPDWTRSNTGLHFFHAAASTIAGMLDREKSLAALGEAESRVRRSQRLDAVGQLAGGIAHDFNNLLTAILGNVDLLETDLPRSSELSSIRHAGESASRLTSQLLAFTRKQVLQTELIDVGEAIQEVAQMLARIIPESITLKIDAEPGKLFTLADSGQLQQVLINLVVNARDAMPDGGMLGIRAEIVTLDDGSAQLETEPDAKPGSYVRIAVTDNGIGIAASSLERVFEPFFSTKLRSQGTGLGLSVVYGIVKQHGGFLEVESRKGLGSEFRVFLTAETEARPVPAPPPTVDVHAARGEGHLLIIEDEQAVRDIAARLLESLGYRVTTAAGGLEALEMFGDPSFKVSAILLDVVMPEMSGIQTYERLREIRPDVPVIFMTGHDPASSVKGLLRRGEASLLRKPFTRAQLGESIRARLGQVTRAD